MNPMRKERKALNDIRKKRIAMNNMSREREREGEDDRQIKNNE